MTDRGNVHIKSEPGLGIADIGRAFDVAQVVEPGDAEQARLGGEHVEHLIEREVRLRKDRGQGEDVEVADAVVLRKARLRLIPMLVASDLPCSIAHKDELPPKWQEMILASSRPSKVAIRPVM